MLSDVTFHHANKKELDLISDIDIACGTRVYIFFSIIIDNDLYVDIYIYDLKISSNDRIIT